MSVKKSQSIVTWFILAVVGAQCAWAQQAQDVVMVDQTRLLNVIVRNIPGVQLNPKAPFQEIRLSVTMNQLAFVAVPADKRAVIKFVSFEAGTDALPESRVLGCNVRTTVNGLTVSHRFTIGSPLPPSGGFAESYRAHADVEIYADGGTDIGFICSNTSASGLYTATVSGYYVPML